jgi:hypothetical protein
VAVKSPVNDVVGINAELAGIPVVRTLLDKVLGLLNGAALPIGSTV